MPPYTTLLYFPPSAQEGARVRVSILVGAQYPGPPSIFITTEIITATTTATITTVRIGILLSPFVFSVPTRLNGAGSCAAQHALPQRTANSEPKPPADYRPSLSHDLTAPELAGAALLPSLRAAAWQSGVAARVLCAACGPPTRLLRRATPRNDNEAGKQESRGRRPLAGGLEGVPPDYLTPYPFGFTTGIIAAICSCASKPSFTCSSE